MLRAGAAYCAAFCTQRFDTGAATDADVLPTATAYRNGVADAWALTVANVTTGLYKVTGTVPAYTQGDYVQVVVSATVNAVAGKAVIDSGVVETYLDAAVSTRSTYAGADTAGTTTLLGRVVGTLAAGTHQPQTGDAYARLGAPAGASVSADVAALPAGILASATGGAAGTVGGNLAHLNDDISDVLAAVEAVPTAAEVWSSPTRTLTSYGTLVADVGTAVWSAGTRTLTSLSALLASISADVWAYATRTLTSTGQVTAVLPVSAAGNITVEQGRDYAVADGAAIRLTSSDWTLAASSTITLHVTCLDGTTLEATATYVSGTAVDVALTKAQTAALPVGTHRYALTETLSPSGRVRGRGRGTFAVLQDY